MNRAFDRVRLDDRAGLPGEQIDSVRGVMPEQVIGPAPRLAFGVHVLATEEIGLDVHLLDGEVARRDPVVDELVARIEPAGVADHAGQAGFLLLSQHCLGIAQAVGERDLDLDMLARVHALDRLVGVHLRGRAQDHRVDIVPREAVGEIGRRMADAIFVGDRLGRFEAAADEGDDLDAVDQLEAVEMFFTECAGTGEGDFHVQILLTGWAPAIRGRCRWRRARAHPRPSRKREGEIRQAPARYAQRRCCSPAHGNAGAGPWSPCPAHRA